jgi:hypothetical protein
MPAEPTPDYAERGRARRRFLRWTARLIEDVGIVVSVAALALLGIAAAAGAAHDDEPAERPTFSVTYGDR